MTFLSLILLYLPSLSLLLYVMMLYLYLCSCFLYVSRLVFILFNQRDNLLIHKVRNLMIKTFIFITNMLFIRNMLFILIVNMLFILIVNGLFILIVNGLFILIVNGLFIAPLALKKVFDHLLTLFMINSLLDCISLSELNILMFEYRYLILCLLLLLNLLN